MLQKSTLKFLKELKNNNDRDWFQANRKHYDAAKEDLLNFVTALIAKTMSFDKDISDQEPKKCIFRINRDIRFSKDKSPYKTNMGAYIVSGGKKSGKAGYYVHIEPGGCFVAGGLYCPPGPALKKVRQEIDYNTDAFRKILKAKKFKDTFGELQGSKVKTSPKGYAKDHPAIDLIRHKDFIVSRSFSDKEVMSEDFLKETINTFKAMKPLNDFLNKAMD